MKRTIIKIMIGCCCCFWLPIVGNSQNFVDATNDASLVPIQLIGFKAILQGNNVQVSWSTATETNNSHFNVLRSLDGNDFSIIGTVNSKGNSSTTTNYSLVDANFPKQNLYYQLEQVDLDGKKTTSTIVLVKMDAKQAQISIFPNPVKGNKLSINIDNIAAGNYSVVVLNTGGTVVYNQQWKADSNVPFSIQLPQYLPAGIYMLQVVDKASSLKTTKQLFIY